MDKQINLDDLIKDFQIADLTVFSNYLIEVWRDLARRSQDQSKGIERLTFSQYYELPGIISDRLFSVFDKNQNGFLDPKEFIEGMTILFSETFNALSKFIFKFYDFDRDGYITKEDVRVVLSYVPIQKKISKAKMKYEQEDFKDRVESQNELFDILQISFGKKEKLNQDEFVKVIEAVSSDIFIFILMFLLEKRPFTNDTIKIYLKDPNAPVSKTPKLESSHKIASPSIKSKFGSPTLKKRTLGDGGKNILSKYAGTGSSTKQSESKKAEPVSQKENVKMNQPQRRARKALENLEDIVPMTTTFALGKGSEGNTAIDFVDEKGEENNEDNDTPPLVKHEGYMFKITHSKKLKKVFFKLIGKDFYYFKSKEDTTHKGMHNLSGIYIKEGDIVTIEGIKLFNFSVLYPKKARTYYIEEEKEYKEWMKKLHLAIDFKNLLDQYEIKEKAGKGKFGLVKLAVHKENGRKVAIKIMAKKDMTVQDLELAKTEIDILKVSQHPNIIKLYDVFDTADFIYIVMEYCSGGDLFSYIEKRHYKLAEPKAAEIIHKLSTAIYYIHSYGIVHRDLKPENILMTDSTDDADIRLLDFGLSKIIGPNEKCTEPFGTLSYVAPEVLKEKPYDKAVDLWSIGIITYLLLCGFLPFDDEHSEREIARQTIQDPVPYPSQVWSKHSAEAKAFVEGLLKKVPEQRISIKQVLEHEWIKKYSKVPEMRLKTQSSESSQFKLYSSDTAKKD